MKFFHKAKDGGPESTVTGYWLIEAKRLFSIALLKFENGSRDAYHSHAFNSLSWVLWGRLYEQHLDNKIEGHKPSLIPVVTRRSTFHRVLSFGTSWALTIRGPWSERWSEFDPVTGRLSVLKNGRVVLAGGMS